MIGERRQPEETDRDGWRAYWRALGQPWRTEPEIAEARRRYLAERRDMAADVERGVFPFKDVAPRLTRADVEWLLAAHAADGDPAAGGEPTGPDLRGVDLSGLDLRGLPLAGIRAGLREHEWRNASAAQLGAAAAHFEQADLTGAHLEGAALDGAHLEGACLREVAAERASLTFAYLEGAILSDAHFEGAALLGARLDGAILNGTRLDGAVLIQASLAGADLFAAHLEGARLDDAHLAGRTLPAEALGRVRRHRTDFPAALGGASLCGVFFDNTTALDEAILGDEARGSVAVADARWGGANLAVVDWTAVREIGDEREARTAASHIGKPKDAATRLAEFRAAVRANRQLVVALREQGLNEEADRYAYRAQVLQREVLRRQALAEPPVGRASLRYRLVRWGMYVFSLFLDGLAGYGYRPSRSLAAYLLSLAGFAVAYFVVGRQVGTPLSVVGAVTLSINSFHGRGFFGSAVTPGDPISVLAAVEAIAGLVIEISFIATFTQRFFGR
jgi:uncharacterized protein YjbI with pentapeptide repeats